MNKTLVYLLVFVYAFTILRPLSPLLNDFIAHTFWKMEHLATVHFENGTYHLHAELTEAANKEEPKAPATSHSNTKSVELLTDHILTDSVVLIPFDFGYSAYFIPLSENVSSPYLSRFGPPPEA
jgi:hypothetical protein